MKSVQIDCCISEIGNVVSSDLPVGRCANLQGEIAHKIFLIRKVNLRKRKKFALVNKNWAKPQDEEKWTNELWNDETKLNLFGNYTG